MKRLLHNLRLLSPNCRQASALVSRAMDRPLTRFERIGVVIHLGLCMHCRNYRRNLRYLRKALRLATGPHALQAGSRLSDSAKARIREAMKE